MIISLTGLGKNHRVSKKTISRYLRMEKKVVLKKKTVTLFTLITKTKYVQQKLH